MTSYSPVLTRDIGSNKEPKSPPGCNSSTALLIPFKSDKVTEAETGAEFLTIISDKIKLAIKGGFENTL